MSTNALDTSYTRKRKEICYGCSKPFNTLDIIFTLYTHRFYGSCVNDGGFLDQDLKRLKGRKSYFKLVCRYCDTKVKLHELNENHIDSKKVIAEMEQKHTDELKAIQADADQAEIAKVATTRQLTDQHRKYDKLAQETAPDLTKYRDAINAYKADNKKYAAALKTVNENLEVQEKMISESQQRELEYSQKLQNHVDIQEQLQHNEKIIATLNAENAQKQVDQ